MKQPACCVHLVDDDEGMIGSLRMFFTSKKLPTVTYRSAEEFVDESSWNSPGCILLDLRMPGKGGEWLISYLAKKPPMPPVIVLTAHGTIDAAVRSIKAGAVEFLQKPCKSDVLLARVLAAIERDRERLRSLERCGELRQRLLLLTPREHDVVRLLTDGLSSVEIAGKLGIKPKSVEVYRSNILTKLGVATSAELVSRLLRDHISG